MTLLNECTPTHGNDLVVVGITKEKHMVDVRFSRCCGEKQMR